MTFSDLELQQDFNNRERVARPLCNSWASCSKCLRRWAIDC